MEEQLNPLNLEWILINASKEALAFVKERGVTYADAIKFARENIPEVFEGSTTGLIRKTALEKLYDRYKEEARGISVSGKLVSAETLIQDRIDNLQRLLHNYPKAESDPVGLQKELFQLIKIMGREEEPLLSLESITEDEAIRMDTIAQRANKVFVKSHLGKYNVYRDAENGSVFQIAVLHPNRREKVTGADLIYEQYDLERRKVRIVAIQYKIWNKRALYFSQASNVKSQIEKLERCFCSNRFCCNDRGSKTCDIKYRLPFCSAFLRPTDRLQNPKALLTSGFHLPICKIETLRESGNKDDIIRFENIYTSALNTYTFEELFNSEMVGSRWLDVTDLEKLYRQSEVLRDSENFTIHVQDLSRNANQNLLNL